MHYKFWYIVSVLWKAWWWLNRVETCCHKNILCNELFCLTEIYTLYESDKRIGMAKVKINLHMLVTSFDLIHLLAQSIVLSLNLFMMDVLLSLLKLIYNSALKSNWCNWKYYKFCPLPVCINYFNIIYQY